MLIDTHAHLDFPEFSKEEKEIIERAKKAGVKKIINVGSSLKRSKKSIYLSEKYPEIYAAVGIHPQEAENIKKPEIAINSLEKMAKNPKVVAIGECGLDFYLINKKKISKKIAEKIKKKQKEIFLEQINLAKKLKKPIIIHCREAFKEMIQLIKPLIKKNFPGGVFHCFSGDKNFLNKIIKMNFYIGFCGNLTFEKSEKIWEIAKIAPLEKILLETDSPFLSPCPYRGLRNEPKNVKIIADFLAKIRGNTPKEISQKTTQNAKNLFKI